MSLEFFPVVTFVVNIINNSLYQLYDVVGCINSNNRVKNEFPITSIASITIPELKTKMKRLLRQSIHKGKFMGFAINGTFIPLESVVISDLPLYRTVNAEIHLVIEYEIISLAQLEEIIQQKKELLEKLGGISKEFTSRLVKDFCWNSDAIEGTTVKREESRVFLDDPKDVEGDDKIELLNHFHTFNQLVLPMKDRPITEINEQYMKSLHIGLDLVNMPHEHKGCYYVRNVFL